MINTVVEAIEQYNMLKNVKTVTVALSGGADSVALLLAMLQLRSRYGITVKAAHLNHNLRGEESDRDERFVRSLCEQHKVELAVKSVDVKNLAQSTKQSVELAARAARYEFFASCDGVVATAHTADDNIETVLLNLVRGTGLEGLCGIPPVREGFIRPLIMCTRAQIEQFCKDNNQPFVTDSTNLTDDYTRNKLRHKVVGVLKEINPAAAETVLRSSAILREDSRYLNAAAKKQYAKCQKGDALDVNVASALEPAILQRVLREFAKSKTNITPDNYHTEQLCSLVIKGEGKCQLQGGYYAFISKHRLAILPDEQQNVSFDVEMQTLDIEEYKKAVKINSLLSKNAIDCDKIIGDAIVRNRMEGDCIKLKGRGTKTLKKLYNELAVAKNMRAQLPVAADKAGVIWVYTAGVAERVAVDANTKKVLLISAQQLQ